MGSFNNDYTSKNQGNWNSAGAIAGGLALLNQVFNGCNGGSFLGLGNNNCNRAANAGAEINYISELQAKIAKLESENYSDKSIKDTYIQTLTDNKSLRDELYAYIKPLSEEAANNRVNIATLQAELKCCCEKQELREEIMKSKISELGLSLKGRVDSLDQTIACIANKVNDVTATVVPKSAVCPEPMPLYNSWTAPTTPAK